MATLRILPTLYATMPPENISQVAARLKEYLSRRKEREVGEGPAETGVQPDEEGGGEAPV
jgi:hypothetical protein